ncbi:MAG: hypothetical protein QOC94_432, partial [Actinoplanes sp.]|nr:hypothetical protein [Actinoplanes sp.]
MTLPEPKPSSSVDLDNPQTQAMTRPAAAAPVFVDSTGRRRRRLRRASYVFGGLCLAYAILVSVSLAGGPVSPGSVLPLRILADGDPPGEAVITTPGPLPQPS